MRKRKSAPPGSQRRREPQPASRTKPSFLDVFLGGVGCDRAPEQDRNQQGKHDDVLEGAALESREALEHADEERANRGAGIADEPADDGADEGLQADQESGIVKDRIDRRDENSGEGRHQRTQEIGDRTRSRGPYAHQPGAGPIHGGGVQRLADQGEVEQDVEQGAEDYRGGDDQRGLPGHVDAGDTERSVDERLRTDAFGSKKQQPEADQGVMQRDRDDQQQEDSGVGDRAEDDAIEQRRNGQDQQKRENDAYRHRQIVGDGQTGGAYRQRRQREIKAERTRQGPPAAQPSQRGRLDQGGERREPEHQAGRAGQTLLLERR